MGLGWHLVKKMVDEIRYVPGTPSGNVLTLVKRKTTDRNLNEGSMEIEMSRSGSITVVGIRGSVDGLTADDLMRTFSDRVTEGSVQLVADCSALDYTSSAGLRSLLGAVKLARQHGGDLRLAAIQAQVLRVLDLSGFTSILKYYPDVQSAVTSFAEPT